MFKNYLKIAWRNLFKNKVSSSINLFGLSVSLALCSTIFIFVEYQSSFDAYHKNAENTFRVVQHTQMPNEALYWNTTAYPLAAALRSDIPQLEEVTQIAGPLKHTFKIETAQEQTLFEDSNVLFVDGHYAKVFDVEWLAGNENTALKNPNSVVLTATLAKKYFGTKEKDYNSLLGKTMALQGTDPLTVTGVVKTPRGNSDHQYHILIPYEFFRVNNSYVSGNWSGNYQGSTYVTLTKTSDANMVESKINHWKKKYLNATDDQRISYHLQPLTEIHNETRYGGSPGGYIMPKRILNIAMAVAFFVLLMAIVNFVNLVTAQVRSRLKEVGVRKVMGGNRTQLAIQFTLENVLLIFFSSLVSVFLIGLMVRGLNNNLPTLSLQLQFQWHHGLFILGVAAITALCAAIYPALMLSSYKPVDSLKNKIQNKRGSASTPRKGLVAFQFIIVQLFVIAVVIVAFQMDYFKNNGNSLSKDAVIITESNDLQKNEVYKQKLLSDGVTQVTFGSGPPMAINGLQLGTNFRLPNRNESQSLEAEMKITDPAYLDFFGLELVAGRNFFNNKEGFDEFIVNQTLLQSLGLTAEEAIGKELQINEGNATIVGVVKDFHNNSLKNAISPCILVNWTYFQNSTFIKPERADQTSLEAIKKDWEDTYTDAIYSFQFLEDAMAMEYALEDMIYKGFKLFSLFAILLGCLGLFGLMSFVVAQKRKEIGIRKVLGATLQQNIGLFSKEYLRLVVLAFLVSAPIAYYLTNRWLEGFSYRIQLTLWMFLLGGLATAVIAIITCSFQSVKAAMANPIKSLRTE